MTFVTVRCPHCDSEQIVKRGKTRRGTQRYLYQNTACITGSFLLDSRHRGWLPAVKQPIIDMRLNASGVRDTARSLHISPTTGVNDSTDLWRRHPCRPSKSYLSSLLRRAMF
jgi:transposase-like protein